ncbi:MAG TPA: HAD family phosphatase [Acetobacteraceae bacterium]|jgi:HAD superfamily hydrolase (TIGR01509 family)|nr:HAD family phosphatase [Acetobacteraceae bacterium]
MDGMAARGLAVEAVVFDMDGLLLDTESLAFRAMAAVGAARGVEVDEAFFHTLVGIPADASRSLVEMRFGHLLPTDLFLAEAAAHMEALAGAGELHLKPGVAELLDTLDARGLARAVATSSGRAKAERHLGHTGILRRFDAVVTRDDVARGKPHPDLFLAAAAQLGRAPARCLALEDSHNGVRAAHAAGMPVAMVPDLLPATAEMRALCVAVLPNLHGAAALLA